MDRPTGLLDLPSEIRQEIWRLCVSTKCNRVSSALDGLAAYNLSLNVFRINRAIYREAFDVFQRCNSFCSVSTPWDNADDYIHKNGHIAILRADPDDSLFQAVHLEVVLQLVDLDIFERSRGLVICEDDLPAFCRLWWYTELTNDAMNQHLSLTLKLQNPGKHNIALSKPEQIRLLDPFINVKRLARVSVEGLVDDAVEQSFLTRIEEPYDGPVDCLNKASHLGQQAAIALREKKFDLALRRAEDAFRAILIIVNGRERDEWGDSHFDVFVASGTYCGHNANFARILIRVELTATIVMAYYGLGQYEMARFWGMRSINTARGWLGGHRADRPDFEFDRAGDFGRIYFGTALACRQMQGQDNCLDEAIGLYRIALGKLPDDPEVAREAPSFNRLESARLARVDLSCHPDL